MKSIELLSPARDLACGKAAVLHGADAVYIGAPRFGARASAGNSIDDIAELCSFAHQYHVRVYATVNTIVYEEELDDIPPLLEALKRAGVDALIVQDVAVMQIAQELGMEIHASTQTDNRTKEKVGWLLSMGASRVVLARELSIEEITAIHNAWPEVELEAFVHGALCVSYSGRCYASQHCFRRSANRGECAQFCRLPFSLEDAEGRVVVHERYLLSLKDMNRIAHLPRMIEAGITSFKIEGRLKDEQYVKNVTAAYRQQIDHFIAAHPSNYCRASLGEVNYTFAPQLDKSFNRGFTPYLLDGNKADIFSFDTPKSVGTTVGKVKSVSDRSLVVAGTAAFANGDGLCYFDEQRQLVGFRVNKAEGNRLFPHQMPPSLHPGLTLYRNVDQQFQRQLTGTTATRLIPITLTLKIIPEGYALHAATLDGRHRHTSTLVMEHQEARQSPVERIRKELLKLGNTIFSCHQLNLPTSFSYFLPAAALTSLRRDVIEGLTAVLLAAHPKPHPLVPSAPSSLPHETLTERWPYLYNIANSRAQRCYEQQGLSSPSPAYELSSPKGALLMQCRHCLRFALGFCERKGGKRVAWREPLFLVSRDGRRFRLSFDCTHCTMNVYAHED